MRFNGMFHVFSPVREVLINDYKENNKSCTPASISIWMYNCLSGHVLRNKGNNVLIDCVN